MSYLEIPYAPHAGGKSAAACAAWLACTVQKLRAGAERRRATAQLSQLDDRTLKDIGLYRTDLVAFGSRYRGSR